MDNEKTLNGWKIDEGRFDSTEELFPRTKVLSQSAIKSIKRHEYKVVKQMVPVYRISETVYFVMRNKHPY